MRKLWWPSVARKHCCRKIVSSYVSWVAKVAASKGNVLLPTWLNQEIFFSEFTHVQLRLSSGLEFLVKHRSWYGISNTRDVFHRDIQTPSWEESWKCDAQRNIFHEIRGVWKADETLSRVFDISSQSKQQLKSKRRRKIVKIYAN